jgi:hypothetical protein
MCRRNSGPLLNKNNSESALIIKIDDARMKTGRHNDNGRSIPDIHTGTADKARFC